MEIIQAGRSAFLLVLLHNQIIHKTRKCVWYTGNRHGRLLPVLLLPRWITASDWFSPSRKHVSNSSTSHYPVGWCWSTTSSTVRSLIQENGGPFWVVPGVRNRVFRWIRAVPGPARPIRTFSTVAAADRKCGPWCVRGWTPTGRTSGSHHMSRKPSGSTSDN